MKIMLPIKTFVTSNAGRATSLSVVTLLGVVVVVICFHGMRAHEASGAASISGEANFADVKTSSGRQEAASVDGKSQVSVSRRKCESIGLQTESVRRDNWPERLRVTGRLELNEGRIAN